MTFGGGAVAMPAAGESTADDPVAVSIDSTTTAPDKAKSSTSLPKQATRRASSAPKTQIQRQYVQEQRATKSVHRDQ